MQHPPQAAQILLATTSSEAGSKAAFCERVTALAHRTKQEAAVQVEYKGARNGD